MFYRVLFHYFDEFVAEYENRFEREYGYFRPVIQEVVEKYLDCGNPKCGFARIRCRDCGSEFLLHFSCHGRGFCPSCHAKRIEEWGEWMRESLVLDVPHRQVVLTIPKMLRIFFKYNRSLLSGLCLCGKEALLKYLILQGGCRQRTYSRDYCRHTIVWVPDKSSPPPSFSCFRGRFRRGGTFPQCFPF